MNSTNQNIQLVPSLNDEICISSCEEDFNYPSRIYEGIRVWVTGLFRKKSSNNMESENFITETNDNNYGSKNIKIKECNKNPHQKTKWDKLKIVGGILILVFIISVIYYCYWAEKNNVSINIQATVILGAVIVAIVLMGFTFNYVHKKSQEEINNIMGLN